MHRIPPGDLPAVATSAGIVEAEALDTDVPDRAVMVDQEALNHCDPEGRHDEEATAEVLDAERAASHLDGVGVLADPVVQILTARVQHRPWAAFACAFGYGATKVDWLGGIRRS